MATEPIEYRRTYRRLEDEAIRTDDTLAIAGLMGSIALMFLAETNPQFHAYALLRWFVFATSLLCIRRFWFYRRCTTWRFTALSIVICTAIAFVFCPTDLLHLGRDSWGFFDELGAFAVAWVAVSLSLAGSGWIFESRFEAIAKSQEQAASKQAKLPRVEAFNHRVTSWSLCLFLALTLANGYLAFDRYRTLTEENRRAVEDWRAKTAALRERIEQFEASGVGSSLPSFVAARSNLQALIVGGPNVQTIGYGRFMKFECYIFVLCGCLGGILRCDDSPAPNTRRLSAGSIT
jgi:hypothetical protein